MVTFLPSLPGSCLDIIHLLQTLSGGTVTENHGGFFVPKNDRKTIGLLHTRVFAKPLAHVLGFAVCLCKAGTEGQVSIVFPQLRAAAPE